MRSNANSKFCGVPKKNKQFEGDDTCRNPAGYMTEHPGFGPCHRHGGNWKTVSRKYTLELVKSQAEQTLKKFGHPEPVSDPLTKLAEIAGEVIAWKDVVKARVDEIAKEDWRYEHRSGEMLRAEVELWERALDRCERFLGSMARMKIDERLAKIEERQADAIIEAFQKTFRDMNMPLAQQTEARKIAAKHLRAITAA